MISKFTPLIILMTILLPACKENQNPTCLITSHTHNSFIEIGVNHTLTVDAKDMDGNIEEVRYYLDATEIGVAKEAPFSLTIPSNTLPKGTFILKAEAIDNDGAAGEYQITLHIIHETGTPGTLTDSRDGKQYPSVHIGLQEWMAENLNYEIAGESYSYDNDPAYADTFGLLYPYETACEVCPEGWHLPGTEEWDEMIDFLIREGYNNDEWSTDNKICKALASEELWHTSTIEGTAGNEPEDNNSTGFSTLPAGYRSLYDFQYNPNPTYYQLKQRAYFWTCTPAGNESGYFRKLDFENPEFRQFNADINRAMSVRCIRD